VCCGPDQEAEVGANGKPLFSETVRVVAVGLWSSSREGVWSSDRRIHGARASVVYEKQGTRLHASLKRCYSAINKHGRTQCQRRRTKNELGSATVHRVFVYVLMCFAALLYVLYM
jgi:hypothetical protein